MIQVTGHLDNFGAILTATIRNGKTFTWDPRVSNPLNNRCTEMASAPTKSVSTIVSDRDRHFIHFGTETTVGDNTTQDPMFIRFSDQENFNDTILLQQILQEHLDWTPETQSLLL